MIVERIEEVCGLYFRSVLLKEKNMVIPQHTHDHDHATLVCSGRASAWADGVHLGNFMAGEAVPIHAGKQHLFVALEPETRLCCVHSIQSAEAVKKKGI